MSMSLLELSLALLNQSLPLSVPSSGFNFVLFRRMGRKEEKDEEGASCRCFQAGTEWVAQFLVLRTSQKL